MIRPKVHNVLLAVNPVRLPTRSAFPATAGWPIAVCLVCQYEAVGQ